MELDLTIQERAELRRLSRSDQPTVKTAAAILLARAEGQSYGEAAEPLSVSRQYASQVCKRFLEGGRLECKQLQERPKPRVPWRDRTPTAKEVEA